MGKVKDRKITVSLAADLADAVDKHVRENPTETNRSKVVEEALRVWQTLSHQGDVQEIFEEAMALYKREHERELYRSFYSSLSEDAKNEAAGWRQIGEETGARQTKKGRASK